jgi:hypothetical protein
MIVALAFAIRSLTANFIRGHLDDASWFQSISYAVFDRQAQAILDHQQPLFWIPDSTRTDLIQHPPAYPIWVALIYWTNGERSPVPVQRVQLLLDSLLVLLLVGVAVTAFGWRVGLIAGAAASLSPLLAIAGATPGADAPASWLVLAGVWALLLAFKRQSTVYAIAAGGLLGLACWIRVNPLFLFLPWMIALWCCVAASWQRRFCLSVAVALSTLLVISPVIIRNLVIFYPQIAPTGLNIGLNLWEGIGETNRGPEFDAPSDDVGVIAAERREMGLSADAPLGLNYPDGIRRDRERGRKALAVIKANPIWYTGTIAKRVWGHLKFAGAPAPHVGTTGINVTSKRCLPPDRQHGPVAILVNVLGAIQSVLRYLALPLMLLGIAMALRRQWRITCLLLATVLYYLLTVGVGHSEIRYGLPMQELLFVFAAVTIDWSLGRFRVSRKSSPRARSLA